MTIKSLIHWSEQEFSKLPWRANRSLYRTLVSEIMLQQTTVGTVKNHFERFLQTFPDLESLANPSEEELIVAWKGLGYYRRARNLKKIAESIVNEFKGRIPHDSEALQKISGIGPYTANALISIGMDKPALAVDANLERVIARLFAIEEMKGPKLHKKIYELFEGGKIFKEKVSFRKLNEALMDLGRTYCQARKASCQLCPLKKDCLAFQQGKSETFPISAEVKKKAVEHELSLLRVYVVKSDKLLVYKKSEKEWLAGQFEVPTFILKSSDDKLQQYPIYSKKINVGNQKFKTGITKYKITNVIHFINEKDFKKLNFDRPTVWKDFSSKEANLSSATLKGLNHLELF